MLRTLLFVFLFSFIGVSTYFLFISNKGSKSPALSIAVKNSDTLIHKKAATLKNYITVNKYNTQYCFIVNMAVPSRFARFYIYDLKNKKVIDKGLVCHGKGSNVNGKFVFNNVVNGGASSKGKYKIGNKYFGKYGLAYKLHGLDTTNSNAFERFVVLHSHACVPEGIIYPNTICQSDGYPTLAPNFLKRCAAIIDASAAPILLYIDYFTT